MTLKGKWLTIEGSEGVGKSTQIKAISDYLTEKDIPFIKTREPGGTHCAETIRELLLTAKEPLYSKTELLLLYAARCQHVFRAILPALEQGRWVICDRFNDSSYAYQGGGRQVDSKDIDWLDSWVLEGEQPDGTLILDAPAQVGLGRIPPDQRDRIESEKLAFFERVRESYLERAASDAKRYRVIDATAPVDVVTEQAIAWVDRWINH
jgi:dTMP kinase